jgi:hypothetical protein
MLVIVQDPLIVGYFIACSFNFLLYLLFSSLSCFLFFRGTYIFLQNFDWLHTDERIYETYKEMVENLQRNINAVDYD